MEKRKLSAKTVLKLIGALFALAYLGFYLYVGITGKFSSMHEAEHILRFGDHKKWVACGMAAVMIFSLCFSSALNDLNLKRIRKGSFLSLFLTMILPIILLLLLEVYLDNGWLGIALCAGIAAFLCAAAWIPLLLSQWISRQLLREEPMSGKQQLRVIEWIHFYPLKKLLIFGLWSFGIVLILRGAWRMTIGKIEMDGGFILFLLGMAILDVALFKRMKRYVSTPYHSIPVLNQILSKNQLEQLLDGEHFEPISFEEASMKQYPDIYRSQNWMLINGILFSKKLALCVTREHQRNATQLNVLYLNGMTAKAKVDLNNGESSAFVLKELTGYEGALKLHGKEEQLAQKFASFFPEQASNQERIAVFLSQDATQIRQDYIQTFSPPPDTRKEKRSRRERR